jgi:anti-sigma regulatory factor (Ser/Thr protein kinase)
MVELDRVLDFINLGQELVEGSTEFWMELLDTIQRIFINIVKYAFPTQCGVVKININYRKEQQAIEISFIDEGIPYNPLEGIGFVTASNKEKMQDDDFGIFLSEKFTEETSYVYLNKKNITTIKKYLE